MFRTSDILKVAINYNFIFDETVNLSAVLEKNLSCLPYLQGFFWEMKKLCWVVKHVFSRIKYIFE